MCDAQESHAQPDEATSSAGLIIEKSPDSTSVSATLPGKNASDLLPMSAIVALTVGPAAVFNFADVPSSPWWVVGSVVLAQLIAVTTVVIHHRAQPRT